MNTVVKSVSSVAASVTLIMGFAGTAAAYSPHGDWSHDKDGGDTNTTLTYTSQHGVFGNCSAIIHYYNNQGNSNQTTQDSNSSTTAPVTQGAAGGVNVSGSGSSAGSQTDQGQGQLGGDKTDAGQTQTSGSSNGASTETGQSAPASNDNHSSASTTTTQSNSNSQSNSSSLTFAPDCSVTNVTNVTQSGGAGGGMGGEGVVNAPMATASATPTTASSTVLSGGGRGADVAAAPTQVSVVPTGSVNAGGGAGTAKDTGIAVAGLTSSIVTTIVGAGLALRKKALGL